MGVVYFGETNPRFVINHSYRNASKGRIFAAFHAGYIPPTRLVTTPNSTPAMMYKKLDGAKK